jgi:hypothetical protein
MYETSTSAISGGGGGLGSRLTEEGYDLPVVDGESEEGDE